MAPCADADDERVLTWTNKPVEFPVPKISFGLNDAAALAEACLSMDPDEMPELAPVLEALEAFLAEHGRA